MLHIYENGFWCIEICNFSLQEKRANSGGIVLLDEECLLETGDGGCKCISILELDDIMHKEMTEEVETTHLERLQFV